MTLRDPGVAQAAADRVRRRLAADRVTVRLDPGRNLPVVGESLAAGVESLRDERAIDQMATDTVSWVAQNGRALAIDDAVAEHPRTPAAMIEGGLRSFIIAPILRPSGLVGTVSVHTFVQRDWTPQEVAEAQAAADLVAEQVVEEQS